MGGSGTQTRNKHANPSMNGLVRLAALAQVDWDKAVLNNDKFKVDASTGDTTVGGIARLLGNVQVGTKEVRSAQGGVPEFAVNIAASTGHTTVAATATVGGLLTLKEGLTVNGNAVINGKLTAKGSDHVIGTSTNIPGTTLIQTKQTKISGSTTIGDGSDQSTGLQVAGHLKVASAPDNPDVVKMSVDRSTGNIVTKGTLVVHGDSISIGGVELTKAKLSALLATLNESDD